MYVIDKHISVNLIASLGPTRPRTNIYSVTYYIKLEKIPRVPRTECLLQVQTVKAVVQGAIFLHYISGSNTALWCSIIKPWVDGNWSSMFVSRKRKKLIIEYFRNTPEMHRRHVYIYRFWILINMNPKANFCQCALTDWRHIQFLLGKCFFFIQTFPPLTCFFENFGLGHWTAYFLLSPSTQASVSVTTAKKAVYWKIA